MPGLARGIGKGMREFQKAADEIKGELINSTSDIRDEMKSIRSDIQKNISEVKPNLNELKSTFNNVINDPNEIKTEPIVSGNASSENAEEESSGSPKTDTNNKSFTDIGANI